MAIALDNSAQSSNLSGSSTSFSYTCTGSNLILIVGVQTTVNQTVSSITYNGVGLTQIATKATPNSARGVDLWYLINPATGSNTLAVNLGGAVSNWFSVSVASYTGVKQTGQPDASGSSSANSGLTDVTQSVTTTANNCWLVGIMSNANSLNPTADSGTTLRQSLYNRSGNGYEGFYLDSNGAKTPAGSYALGVTADSGGGTIIVASIAPSAAAQTNGAFLYQML